MAHYPTGTACSRRQHTFSDAELEVMEMGKVRRTLNAVGVTSHRDFYWPTSDDWYPNFVRNTVHVRVSAITPRKGLPFVRLSVWGADDFGMERDLPATTPDEKQASLEAQLRFADTLPNPLTQAWLAEQGFVRA